MGKMTKDSDGNKIYAGDRIRFSYGIPPVRVVASIVDKGGELIALTPDHKPTECRLSLLRQYVGCFYKEEVRRPDPRDIESNLFTNRRSALEEHNGKSGDTP